MIRPLQSLHPIRDTFAYKVELSFLSSSITTNPKDWLSPGVFVGAMLVDPQ